MSKDKKVANHSGLNRSLSSGQMEMIALGGTIGVGLFMDFDNQVDGTVSAISLCGSRSGLVCSDARLGGNDLY